MVVPGFRQVERSAFYAAGFLTVIIEFVGDINFVAAYSDHLIALRGGLIVTEGGVEDAGPRV